MPPAFAVLLYRAVYFRFSRGLIAILPSGLGFFACLRLLFLVNSTPSIRVIRVPFYVPYRSCLFSRPSADLTRLRPTCAFMLCFGYFSVFGLRFRLYANLLARPRRRLPASLLFLFSSLTAC